MKWNVLYDDEFIDWLEQQEIELQNAILSLVEVLIEAGPGLGRPRVDTIKGSKLRNLKELRVQYRGEPWRVLFAFDPQRQAILLVGGNKQGNDRWYKEAISIAEKRYKRHLEELENDNG
jgi:hypothetical protein